MTKKDSSKGAPSTTGKILLRRDADGSFRVDEKSLYSAPGVKQQAEAARLISVVLRARRKSA